MCKKEELKEKIQEKRNKDLNIILTKCEQKVNKNIDLNLKFASLKFEDPEEICIILDNFDAVYNMYTDSNVYIYKRFGLTSFGNNYYLEIFFDWEDYKEVRIFEDKSEKDKKDIHKKELLYNTKMILIFAFAFAITILAAYLTR